MVELLFNSIENFDGTSIVNIEGLSLDQMRIALAVQETGSFAGAAKRYTRAQSAVSYAVGSLEAQLGVPLFDRSGHRAVPTAASVTLLREMAMIVARCDVLRATADALSTGAEPVVRIVVDQLFDITVVAELLAEFAELFRSTRVELKSECMEAVIRHVETSSELGILASLATLPAHIASTTIGPIGLVPVAAATWPDGKDFDSVRAQGVQIVLGNRNAPPDGQDFLVFGARTWRVDDLTTKLALLRAGAGWGYMPFHMVEEDLSAARLQRLNVPGLPEEDHQPVFVLWQPSRQQGPAVSWLIQRLRSLRAPRWESTTQ